MFKKKTQIEHLEIKTMSEMKNMLDRVNGRLDVTEEKISEFEDIGI